MRRDGLSACTVNRYLGSASALFSPERVKHLGFTVTSPFAGIKPAKRPSSRYHSQIDLPSLAKDALVELSPEQLKFFLLAGLAGLRRGEVYFLEWVSFNWDKGTVNIVRTQ